MEYIRVELERKESGDFETWINEIVEKMEVVIGKRPFLEGLVGYTEDGTELNYDYEEEKFDSLLSFSALLTEIPTDFDITKLLKVEGVTKVGVLKDFDNRVDYMNL